jgi:hypothetical protein
VIHAEEEDLAVQIVHPSDRTLGPVRWQRQRVGSDLLCVAADRGERKRMIAAADTGQSPEEVGRDAEVGGGRRAPGIVRRGVVVTP